jgi:hypothetical protein
MAEITVSFKPLARGRYQPRVWRGELTKRGTKVWEFFKPIKCPQLEAFRNRMTARPRRNTRVVHPPQKPSYWRDAGMARHLEVGCRCGTPIPIKNDTMRATCPRCDAITPVAHDYL